MDTQLDTTRAVPIRIRDGGRLQLLLVGCGGNGSHLTEAIARCAALLIRQGQKVDLTFIDPDVVEAGNIPRQSFCAAEVGLNKAQTLAFRHSARWGLKISAIPGEFQHQEFQYYNKVTILIGCVDNTKARAEIAAALQHNQEESPCVWWLDLGNDQDSGQVILGSAINTAQLRNAFQLGSVCTALPAPAWIHPELVKPKPKTKQAATDPTTPPLRGCAQLALTNAQMPAVNQMTAAIAGAMLTKLLVTKDLTYWASYFDLRSGKQVSLGTSVAAVENAIVDRVQRKSELQ